MIQTFFLMDFYIRNFVMINITTFKVNKDDGSKQSVATKPVLIQLREAEQFTGVYRLTNTDLTGKELGEVAFHLYNNGDWEFTISGLLLNIKCGILDFLAGVKRYFECNVSKMPYFPKSISNRVLS